MPSTHTNAVLVALLVVLAGCSALPGGGGSNPQSGPAEHHLAVLSTSTHAFNATVTVTDPSGETVLERDFSFEANQPRYVNLTTLNQSGNYTVHVQTDLPAVGGGDMGANATVSVDPGPETTVVHTDFEDIDFVTGTARSNDIDVPVRYGWVFPRSGEISYTVYRGSTAIIDETIVATGSQDNLKQAGSISKTGVYWVESTTNYTQETRYGVGVVNESTEAIVISTTHDGHTKVKFWMNQDDGGFAKVPPMAESET